MLRVLLSDDDDAVRGMLRAMLERDGLDVVTVGSVPEALQRIATESFDLLLSDLHMPGAGVERDEQLSRIPLGFEDRAGHLPNLTADLIHRLRVHPAVKFISSPAHQHGQLRRKQGCSAAMVVEESRFLQVSIFGTLQNNLSCVDFSKVLLDVVTIADEVDSQLRDAMVGYCECPPGPGWSAA